MNTILTIGHGNRDIDGFLGLLDAHGVECLVDVRSYPVSRRYPWFSGEALRNRLAGAGIDYRQAGRVLGGRRRAVAGSVHGALDAAWRGYADHMLEDDFVDGITRLRELADARVVAVMCAERDPQRCHRSMIADYLVADRVEVAHIVDAGSPRPHRLHDAVRVDRGRLYYDRPRQASLL